MLRTRLTVLALILSAGVARAGIENAGTTAANFLSVGTGAGILAMGGATLGTGNDLNATAWNPATLGFLSSSQYAVSHASLALDVSQDWVAGAGRFGRSDTRWAASALYQNDGTFDGRDAFGTPTGSFNVSNLALGVSIARPLTPVITAGARFQLLNESLGSASGSGFGMDLGLQARSGAFGFGAAARNIGGSMKYDSGTFDLPAVWGFGASWADETRGLRFALDANFPHAYYNDVRFGGEWTWQQRVALRAGYRLELGAGPNEPLGGPSFGFGTGVNGFWFDYAFLAGASQAQGEHRFGLTFHPSVFRSHGPAPMADATPAAPAAGSVAASAQPAKDEPAKTEPQVAASKPDEAQAAKPVSAPNVAVTAGDSGSETAARASAPAVAGLAPSKSVKVPKLAKPAAIPAPEPVAAKTAPGATTSSAAKPESTSVAAAAPAKAQAKSKTATKSKAQSKPKTATKSKAEAPAAPVADSAAPPASPPVAKVASTTPPVVVVVKHPAKEEAKPDQPAKNETRPAEVVVKKGETLEKIARRWGTSVPAIMMENNMVRAKVKPGQKIRLPKN